MQDIFVFLAQNTFGTEIYLLPTLSMRRATVITVQDILLSDISIHALHAESDCKRLQKMFNLLFVMS